MPAIGAWQQEHRKRREPPLARALARGVHLAQQPLVLERPHALPVLAAPARCLEQLVQRERIDGRERRVARRVLEVEQAQGLIGARHVDAEQVDVSGATDSLADM
jgi:hypothetical protein